MIIAVAINLRAAIDEHNIGIVSVVSNSESWYDNLDGRFMFHPQLATLPRYHTDTHIGSYSFLARAPGRIQKIHRTKDVKDLCIALCNARILGDVTAETLFQSFYLEWQTAKEKDQLFHWNATEMSEGAATFLADYKVERLNQLLGRPQHEEHQRAPQGPKRAKAEKAEEAKKGRIEDDVDHDPGQPENLHKCTACDKVFKTRGKLLNHDTVVHGPKDKCEHCEKEYAPGKAMIEHLKYAGWLLRFPMACFALC
jgi:hypothetical protein